MASAYPPPPRAPERLHVPPSPKVPRISPSVTPASCPWSERMRSPVGGVFSPIVELPNVGTLMPTRAKASAAGQETLPSTRGAKKHSRLPRVPHARVNAFGGASQACGSSNEHVPEDWQLFRLLDKEQMHALECATTLKLCEVLAWGVAERSKKHLL